MKVQIISLTKGTEKNLEPLEEDYKKRLSRSCTVQFVEIKRQDLGRGKRGQGVDQCRLRERVGKDTLILLDERGKQTRSIQLSKHKKNESRGALIIKLSRSLIYPASIVLM